MANEEIQVLLAEARELVLQKTGIDIAIDPDVKEGMEMVIKAMWKYIDDHNWPRDKMEGFGRYSLVNPLIQVSADIVAGLNKRIRKLEKRLTEAGIALPDVKGE